MKNKILIAIFLFGLSTTVFLGCNPHSSKNSSANAELNKLPDSTRIKNLQAMKWGLFLHWSLGTFSGEEWTTNVKSPDFFAAKEMKTDQWCQAAKEAGMGYIIFVAKHHDGFCLWDTKTTEFKVTNSPLKKDALAELRKSCDKYGIKLCLYFSEADWTWPKMENAGMKAAQLKELFTNYGEIPLVWMDVAQWDGGLDHDSTEALIRKYQPNCFIGFNHGLPAGELQSRERGTFDQLYAAKEPPLAKPVLDSLVLLNKKYVLDLNWTEAGKIEAILMNHYNRYLVAECAFPINQVTKEDVYWFYNDQHKDNAIPAEKVFEMYKLAVNSNVLFSLALGPDKNGELRKVDIERLKEVGKMIRNL
ncbi:MAG: alpha-L-fucosidase [Ferruginibacter sp.]